jgi:hypothetical protein
MSTRSDLLFRRRPKGGRRIATLLGVCLLAAITFMSAKVLAQVPVQQGPLQTGDIFNTQLVQFGVPIMTASGPVVPIGIWDPNSPGHILPGLGCLFFPWQDIATMAVPPPGTSSSLTLTDSGGGSYNFTVATPAGGTPPTTTGTASDGTEIQTSPSSGGQANVPGAETETGTGFVTTKTWPDGTIVTITTVVTDPPNCTVTIVVTYPDGSHAVGIGKYVQWPDGTWKMLIAYYASDGGPPTGWEMSGGPGKPTTTTRN